LYLAFGYPSAWFKVEEWSEPRPLPFVGKPTTPADSKMYDSRVHFALGFEREAIQLPLSGQELVEDRLPKLQGISGCGIWRIIRKGKPLGAWNEDMIRLVAIEHHCKHDAYMLGTWMRVVIERIGVEYPSAKRASSIVYR
jgi:hypothetical protein